MRKCNLIFVIDEKVRESVKRGILGSLLTLVGCVYYSFLAFRMKFNCIINS